MGDGSSPHSLSRADIGRSPRGGCRLPDAILRANGVSGLVAGPSEILRLQISSEAFQLASAGGCATGLPTRFRHIRDFICASEPLDAGRPPVLPVRWPASRVSPLNSQVAFVHRSAVSFDHRRRSEVFPAICLICGCFPVRPLCLSGFRRFSLGGFKRLIESARVVRPVLMHSSNQLPSG